MHKIKVLPIDKIAHVPPMQAAIKVAGWSPQQSMKEDGKTELSGVVNSLVNKT
jgi:hypothetical protein